MKQLLLPFLLLIMISSCKKDESPKGTVKINGVLWMTNNLNVDHYRNGDPIPYATSEEEWKQYGKDGIGAYFKTSAAIDDKYGKLYNWYAVNDERGLAPENWSVPTRSEFEELRDAAGGVEVAGMNLKAKKAWKESGLSSKPTDKLDWSALPGGERTSCGDFVNGGKIRGKWWTDQEWDIDTECPAPDCGEENRGQMAWSFGISNEWDYSWLAYRSKSAGFSVRCIEERFKH